MELLHSILTEKGRRRSRQRRRWWRQRSLIETLRDVLLEKKVIDAKTLHAVVPSQGEGAD